MAIKKKVTASNGIVTEYHRIALVTVDMNNQVTVLVNSYLSEDGRQIEKDYAKGLYNDLEPGGMVFPFVQSQYINLPYDPDMTAEKAYRSIKKTSEFEGAEDVFDAWNGNRVDYKVGDYLSYNDDVYKVIQNHTSQADWTPDVAVSLYVKVPDPRIEFADFVQPTGPYDVYLTGDKVTYKGEKYESLIDNNVWSPEAYPSGWRKVEEEEGESGEDSETSEWVQPLGSHDAYAKDAIVKDPEDGLLYKSKLDGNVWGPPHSTPDFWELYSES